MIRSLDLSEISSMFLFCLINIYPKCFSYSVVNVCSLRNTCRNSATAALDQSSPLRFDNQFFKQIRKRRGVLQVDQRLASDPQTRGIVARYANNNAFFKRQFVRAMVKMGAVDVLTGRNGEIRRNCRRFN